MLAEIINTIPAQPGSYALWLHLGKSQNLAIGKLRVFPLPAGDYVYLGSARGPGGLRARLGRHLRGEGKFRWHIDYLRAVAQVRGFGFVMHGRDTIYRIPTECDWSQRLAATSEAQIAAPGFGASDCQSGCAAHLIHMPSLDIAQISTTLNCGIHILSLE